VFELIIMNYVVLFEDKIRRVVLFEEIIMRVVCMRYNFR
jgi:hypothetical protein